MLTVNKWLKVAGWFSIVNAIIVVPILIIAFGIDAIGDFFTFGPIMPLAEIVLNFTSLALYVCVFLSLKKMLNFKFQFHRANACIWALIWFNIIFIILSIVLPFFIPHLEQIISMFALFAMVPLGIISIMLAVRMLSLTDDLYGLLKPFAYTTFASGICYALIISFPLGLIVSVSSNVILAKIFFKASRA